MRVLTTPNKQRMKFGKIHKFLVVLKIWHKIWEFWTLRTCKGWNLAKSRNFQSHWKLGSNYESFDYSKPAKDEIWQNSQIFSRAENLAQNLRVLNTQDMQRMKFSKIQKFSVALKILLEIESLTTPDLQRMKFGKIKKSWFVSKTSSKLTFLTTQNMWRQNPEIFSCVENLAKKWEFDQSELAKDEIWQNPERFWFVLKIWLKNQIFDHYWPVKGEILQNQEILIHVESLAQNWHLWPLWTYERWSLAKSRTFERPWIFGSKLRVLMDLRKDKIWWNQEI